MDDADWAAVEADLAQERTLPDGVVAGTDLAGWQALLDLIRDQGWRAVLRTDAGEVPAPARAADLVPTSEHPTLMVWPVAGLQVNVFPSTPDRIDFDVDSTEVVALGGPVLGEVVRALGRAVGRPVVLSHEGGPDLVILRYDPATDTLRRS